MSLVGNWGHSGTVATPDRRGPPLNVSMPGQTPRNCGVFAACVHGPWFAEKRVVVDAVSSEPVSAEFPVKQGINREFLQNHPLIRPIGPSNTLVSLAF